MLFSSRYPLQGSVGQCMFCRWSVWLTVCVALVQEEREAKELERRMAERDPHHKGRFMAAVEKEVSGTGAGGGTLSDRVRGRAFLSQRGAGDG